jgi:hypothetical protein
MSVVDLIERHGTSARDGSSPPIQLKLGYHELDLIHRSLEAVRTLGLVERQDELLTDTLQLIDVALEEAT